MRRGYLLRHPIGNRHRCFAGRKTDAFEDDFSDSGGQRDVLRPVPPRQLITVSGRLDTQVEVAGRQTCGVEVLDAVVAGEAVGSVSLARPEPSVPPIAPVVLKRALITSVSSALI